MLVIFSSFTQKKTSHNVSHNLPASCVPFFFVVRKEYPDRVSVGLIDPVDEEYWIHVCASIQICLLVSRQLRYPREIRLFINDQVYATLVGLILIFR